MSWVKLDYFRFASGRRPLHAVEVRLDDGELDAATIDAWASGRGEALEAAIALELRRVEGLPDDCLVLSVWREPSWRWTVILLAHPSFELVHPGMRAPVFGPPG